MKAWQLNRFGFDGLELVDRPMGPVLGDHDVRIDVMAVSLNYVDPLVILGHYNPEMPLPRVPVADGAGLVTEVGSRVERFKPGDRVITTFLRDWQGGPLSPAKHHSQHGVHHDGALQESMVTAQWGLVAAPRQLDFAEAATLPTAAVTAWSVLREAGVGPNSTVLVLGTGGVSIFALQFAKVLGARVIVTSSNDAKLARAAELGADDGINYTTQPDWELAVLRATDGAGVDCVVEVGGLQTLGKSLACLRQGGYIGVVGFLAGMAAVADFTFPLLLKNARVRGVIVGSREAFEEMNAVIEAKNIRPVVDRRIAFDDARAGLEKVLAGGVFGKAVVEL
jgi:NADPH:quinone reductase-like Zn-dependent oxidoreductase